MFSLSLLCKKNASRIQNYPCKYSLNWKPFRHKEMEFLPFLVVKPFDTPFWICCVILSKETLASVRVMNHVHSVTFLHRYIVSVDNKFRKTYLLWKRGQSISTDIQPHLKLENLFLFLYWNPEYNSTILIPQTFNDNSWIFLFT